MIIFPSVLFVYCIVGTILISIDAVFNYLCGIDLHKLAFCAHFIWLTPWNYELNSEHILHSIYKKVWGDLLHVQSNSDFIIWNYVYHKLPIVFWNKDKNIKKQSRQECGITTATIFSKRESSTHKSVFLLFILGSIIYIHLYVYLHVHVSVRGQGQSYKSYRNLKLLIYANNRRTSTWRVFNLNYCLKYRIQKPNINN